MNQEGTAHADAVAMLATRPTKYELNFPITVSKLEAALKDTKDNKAPGLDGIPSEIIKHDRRALREQLLLLYNPYWEQQKLSQDFKVTLIVTI